MDTNIYNEEVMSLKTKIDDLEEDIIKGRKKVETLDDFNEMFQKTQNLIDVYNYVYYNLPTNVSREKLLSVFERENNFLELFFNYLTILKQYHDLFHFMSKEEIKLEWDSIKIILGYNRLNSNRELDEAFTEGYIADAQELNNKMGLLEMKNENAISYIEKLGNATERVLDEELINLYNKEEEIRVKNIQKEAQETLKVIDYFIERLDDVKEKNVQKEDMLKIAARKEDISVNNVYLNSLSSYEEKKAYLNLILANIEKLPGRKMTVKYNGNKKRISKQYASYWLNCNSKLKEIEREGEIRLQKYEEEYQDLLKKVEEKKEYEKLTSQFQNTEEELFSIRAKANQYLNTNDVIAVATFKGEPFYALRKDLNEFNRDFMKYKKCQHDLLDFAKKNDIEITANIEKLESAEQKTYQEIKLLESREKLPENMVKLKSLKEQFSKIYRSKVFATYNEIKMMFEKLAIPEEKSEFLTDILENPFKFLYDKEHTNEDKRNTFSSILINIEDHIKKCKEQKLERFSEKSTSIIEKVKRQVNRCVQLLPSKNKKSFKIFNIRNAKNKQKVVRLVLASATATAITCGIFASTNETTIIRENNKSVDETILSSLDKSTLSFNTLEEINDSLENDVTSIKDASFMEKATMDNVESLFKEKEEPKSRPTPAPIITPKEIHQEEKTNYKLGDIVTLEEDALVYTDYLKGADKEDGKTPYFDADTLKTITGIAYEYNGAVVFLSQEDEIKAIEANGGRQVDVRVTNELGTGPGEEGFYSVEDLHAAEQNNSRGGR